MQACMPSNGFPAAVVVPTNLPRQPFQCFRHQQHMQQPQWRRAPAACTPLPDPAAQLHPALDVSLATHTGWVCMVASLWECLQSVTVPAATCYSSHAILLQALAVVGSRPPQQKSLQDGAGSSRQGGLAMWGLGVDAGGGRAGICVRTGGGQPWVQLGSVEPTYVPILTSKSNPDYAAQMRKLLGHLFQRALAQVQRQQLPQRPQVPPAARQVSVQFEVQAGQCGER